MLFDPPCIFLVVCLQYIPMSVLYGVFLFMGVASVKGIQVTVYDAILTCDQKLTQVSSIYRTEPTTKQ